MPSHQSKVGRRNTRGWVFYASHFFVIDLGGRLSRNFYPRYEKRRIVDFISTILTTLRNIFRKSWRNLECWACQQLAPNPYYRLNFFLPPHAARPISPIPISSIVGESGRPFRPLKIGPMIKSGPFPKPGSSARWDVKNSLLSRLFERESLFVGVARSSALNTSE